MPDDASPTPSTAATADPAAEKPRVPTVGCVSYLNAKPLIHGLDPSAANVHFDVPSRLIETLRDGRCDVALCSVIDACREPERFEIVPVGGIACEGPTWTVRLFSRVPIGEIGRVHLDADSHTSVMLLRVLLAERFGVFPEAIDTDFRLTGGVPDTAQAALLIGDKVVTTPPNAHDFPHVLDLGEAWHAWTCQPFVFATWLRRRGEALGTLPAALADCRNKNLASPNRLDALVDTYAPRHGWPAAQARDYLGRILRYTIGPRELEAVRTFAAACQRLIRERPECSQLGPVSPPAVAGDLAPESAIPTDVRRA